MYKHTFYYFLGNKKYPEIYILHYEWQCVILNSVYSFRPILSASRLCQDLGTWVGFLAPIGALFMMMCQWRCAAADTFWTFWTFMLEMRSVVMHQLLLLDFIVIWSSLYEFIEPLQPYEGWGGRVWGEQICPDHHVFAYTRVLIFFSHNFPNLGKIRGSNSILEPSTH